MALPDLCKRGHDRAAVGRNKRGECRACCASQKRAQLAKHPGAAKARQARWYDRNRDVMQARSRERLYGVSPADFRRLSEHQAGLCAVCCEPLPRGKGCHIDHDHKTGAVRGLLCNCCNVGVGMFKDDTCRLASALDYLGRAA